MESKLAPEKLIKLFTLEDWCKREKAIKNLVKHKKFFKKYYALARKGKLLEWKNTVQGKLALILIYDQIPRIIFKDKRFCQNNLSKLIKNARNFIITPPTVSQRYNPPAQYEKIVLGFFAKVYGDDMTFHSLALSLISNGGGMISHI